MKSPLRVKVLENLEPASFHKLGLELLRHSDKTGHFRSAQEEASSFDLFFWKLCKSKAHHTSLTSFTCHSYLGCIPKPLHTLTHSEKSQLQRTTKSPLREVKALENLEPGPFHKLGLELLPHSDKAQHLRSTQEDASSFDLIFQHSANQMHVALP